MGHAITILLPPQRWKLRICDLSGAGCNGSACNYDAAATVNDGSCDFATCFNIETEGCTTHAATSARTPRQMMAARFLSCLGMGCTDKTPATTTLKRPSMMAAVKRPLATTAPVNVFQMQTATAFAISLRWVVARHGCQQLRTGATDNNGTCTYDSEGCMDQNACNFIPQATTDNGSCAFECWLHERECMQLRCVASMHDAGSCSYIFTLSWKVPQKWCSINLRCTPTPQQLVQTTFGPREV